MRHERAPRRSRFRLAAAFADRRKAGSAATAPRAGAAGVSSSAAAAVGGPVKKAKGADHPPPAAPAETARDLERRAIAYMTAHASFTPSEQAPAVTAIKARVAEPLTAHRRRLAELPTDYEPTRADLHALLDACLDLAPLAAEGHCVAREAAREIGNTLLEGALGWTVPLSHPLFADSWEAIEGDPTRWRLELNARVGCGATLLPREVLEFLMPALAHLDYGEGTAPALLAPAPKEGRKRNPRLARECEEEMCYWIDRQIAAGIMEKHAVAEVAAAAGTGESNVRKWKRKWDKRTQPATAEVTLEANKADPAVAPLACIARAWRHAATPMKTI